MIIVLSDKLNLITDPTIINTVKSYTFNSFSNLIHGQFITNMWVKLSEKHFYLCEPKEMLYKYT